MIEYQAFIDNGMMGIIIAWFMFRMEKVVKNNTDVLHAVKEKIKRDG